MAQTHIPHDTKRRKPKRGDANGQAAASCLQENKRQKFIYGNYDRYYGYRVFTPPSQVHPEADEDPRLKLFKKEWFEGKDCLDIGCNEGYLTIAISQKFSCKNMLGIDIDQELVHRARSHLKRAATALQKRKPAKENIGDCAVCDDFSSTVENQNVCSRGTGRESAMETMCASASEQQSGLSGMELLERVRFTTENFIEAIEADSTYDTVLCLSLTKWIHLNWGDRGLICLFAKIWRLLRPGGVLLLEPQPWKSYKSKRNVSEVAQKNFREIVLRPQHFLELLLEKIGFRSYELVSEEVPNRIAGFNRPIFLVYK